MIGGSHHPIREGRSSTSSQSSCESGSSFDPSVTPPMLKRSREEFDGKEGQLIKPHSEIPPDMPGFVQRMKYTALRELVILRFTHSL